MGLEGMVLRICWGAEAQRVLQVGWGVRGCGDVEWLVGIGEGLFLGGAVGVSW